MPEAPADPDARALPRPFYGLPWRGAEREAAQALWQWHSALAAPRAPLLDGDDLTAYFEAEQADAAAGKPLKVVDEEVWRGAYAACEAHDLPPALLARQVGAARRFKRERIAFETPKALDAFLRRWVFPHGMLLARLAEAGHAWQERAVFELARGFFLTGRLNRLPRDVRAGRLFIPESDLGQYGVAPRTLREGPLDGRPPSKDVRRLLWKQSVRARDALAQGQEAIVKELPRRHAFGLRCYWLGALDVLDQHERRNFDLWSGPPVRLGRWRRSQVYLQAFLGRTGR
jgi:phytoene synthase